MRRCQKCKLSKVKFLLGFSLILAFSSISSLTAASIDVKFYEKLVDLGPKIWTKERSYILIALYENFIWAFNFILLLSIAGRYRNLLFEELRKYRKSLSMTQIRGKEYGLNQEMFNVSNLLFTNQTICFLSQEEYPA